jgi:hypothetical protein
MEQNEKVLPIKKGSVWGHFCPHTPCANNLFQIFSLDVATIYQFFLVIVNINADRD